MAKNFKGKAQRPPLSLVDKLIYGILTISFPVISIFVLIFFAEFLPEKLAYLDPYVLACWPEGFLWVLPIASFIPFLMVIPVIYAEKRQPIFGNRRYKAPAFSHTIKVEPLLSPEFWQTLSLSSKQRIKKTVNYLLIALAACLLCAALGLAPRYVFTYQREFIRYNSFNYPTDSRSIYDTQKLIIRTTHYRNRGSESWDISMDFVFDLNKDTTYALRPGYFEQMSREEVLRHMLYLKSHFNADKYEVSGTDLLADVVRYQKYTDTEAELLYQLFDIRK